ncbi:MAG TPA: hypothetical protein VIH99_11535 [Bdellovibrionota bacterium]|jgi:hypothetical protein
MEPGKFVLVLIVGMLASLAALEGTAEAKKKGSAVATTPPACETSVAGPSIMIPEFTGYSPSRGGINGSCNGGASSGLGFKACKNTLQKFISGQAPFIHVAAQQYSKNGVGSADLFGCWAKTDGLSKRNIPVGPHSCHILAIADHYAKKESENSRGSNGKIQGSKLDIEVGKLDSTYQKLAKRVPATVACLKRIPGVQNRDKWANTRKPPRH